MNRTAPVCRPPAAEYRVRPPGGQATVFGAAGRQLLCLLAMLAPMHAAFADQAGAAAALDCMIQPHQTVLVGSPAPGILDSVLVERGDRVVRGQPVVQLNATLERAAYGVARQRAAHVGEVTVASSAQELAQRELQRASELYEQNFVSKTFLDKSRTEAQVARGRSEQAQESRSLAQRQLNLAAAQLEQRTIRSPISGVVVERLMSPGEYVEQRPVLRIAAIDPLRVDVLVPAAAFGQIEPGMTGRVVPEMFDRKAHLATVKSVDRLIDAASNTFRVRLELPNPDGALPAGLRCKVELGLKLPAAAASPAAASALVAGATPPPARR